MTRDDGGRTQTGQMRVRRNNLDPPEPDAVLAGLTGDSHGHNMRHVIIRRAFLVRFLRDRRVKDLFGRWDERSGVAAEAIPLLETLEESHRVREERMRAAMTAELNAMAKERGLEDWTQLPKAKRLPEVTEEEFERWLSERKLSPEVQAVFAALQACWHRAPLREMLDEARDFVKGLDLPWFWLTVELLLEAHKRHLRPIFFVEGVPLEEHHWAESVDLPMPADKGLHVDPQPGETVRQFLARVDRGRENLALELQPTVPIGMRPGEATSKKLERYADWFYRRVVCKEPEIAIARRDFGEDDVDNHRATVRRGVRTARELLSLGLSVDDF